MAEGAPMKKKKTGRRFVQHVKVKKVYGKAVEIPKELQTEIHTREPDHVAMLTCPFCGAVRYVTQAQLDFIAELGKQAKEEGDGSRPFCCSRAQALQDNYAPGDVRGDDGTWISLCMM